MSELVKICSRSELPPEGEAREVVAGNRQICVANLNGCISAMDNVCPHQGGPLGQGVIEDGKVVCPWHAWAFDLKTGVAEHSPHAKVDVYAVKLDGEDVFVEL
jgi:nitrite reductase (NADH) small subunit